MSLSQTLDNSDDWRRVIDAITATAPVWRAADLGIVDIRPGFRRVGAEVTTEKAIVVEMSPAPSGETAPLPPSVDGIPVSVISADPATMMQGGDALAAWQRAHGGAASAEATKAPPSIGYQPPPGAPLTAHDVSDVTCHVGPDSGWSTLSTYLGGATKRLSVSMYELTAPHIVTALENLSAPSLEMILQQDADEAATIDALRARFGQEFVYAPAVISGAHRIFANSYHTKLAVRDGTTIWHSSGNWSPHSQPVVAPDDASPYRAGNREWHVLINDAKLAKLLETYIHWDRQQAANVASEEAAPTRPDLLVPESALLDLEAAAVQPHRFESKRFPEGGGPAVQVEPLMTPDNYGQRILELIESAEQTLLMQYAYIRQPAYAGLLEALVKAVAKQMKVSGMDVRVIVDSRNEKPADIDFLLGLGWKPAKFRKQRTAVHNKGILVDDRFTVVGSQNWSSDGVEFNRDATMLFDSPGIAAYYREVFDFDWNNLTKPVQTAEITPLVAAESAPTPRGMVRIPWSRWYAD